MAADPVRLRVRCRGAVQGVGFRPTVHRLATELGLTGWVINDPEGATAEVQGSRDQTSAFTRRLPLELPPLAALDSMEVSAIPPEPDAGFEVRTSRSGRRSGALVPPDATLCADCRHDMEDPDDRRHHYPFTTCTNCGPRFSLVHALPYDRERTAMACFPLCPACRAEYEDPADRRFHAEPVCCPDCGPRLWLVDAGGHRLGEGYDAVCGAREALLDGAVLAIKGLGGFQLACRADDPDVVGRLRDRKHRPSKPFAVMVRELDAARSLVELFPKDEQLMRSHRSPVLLAPRRSDAPVAPTVAPGLEDLGILLPTTPLHVEIFRDPRLPALVMTSANLSEEPICRGNREALERLGGIADLFLLHDRDVVRRVDDSVLRSTGGEPFMVRRARGWVPEPLPMPVRAPVPLTAVGGHLQTTACVVSGDQAFPSQHVGDLDSEPARAFLAEALTGLEEFLQVTPAVIVADAHPDYPSRWLAEELAGKRQGRLLTVQHHLAHAAAVLAEHGAFPAPGESCLALCLDGTGWGSDATAWGGEWIELSGDLRWRRLAHLETIPLVGGELAVREPWRVAVAALVQAGCADLLTRLPLAEQVDAAALRAVVDLAHRGGWPLATGAGRLFEACGAVLGLAARNAWEGEAAARLETLAAGAPRGEPWPGLRPVVGGGPRLLPATALLAAAARRAADGEDVAAVARGFHASFSALATAITLRVARVASPVVVAGGGCLVNRLLRCDLTHDLARAGVALMLPERVPAGDGGLAYGQAAVAAVATALDLPDHRLLGPDVESGGV